MDEITAVIGRGTLEPQSGKPGSYQLSTSISRFLSVSSHRPNTPFVVGRAMYRGDRCVGRVTDVDPGATSLRIKPDSPITSEDRKTFDGAVLLAGPGDRLVVPLHLKWRASL